MTDSTAKLPALDLSKYSNSGAAADRSAITGPVPVLKPAASAPAAKQEEQAELGQRLRIAEQKLRQRGERIAELEADLCAAEEHLHRVEAELRVTRQRAQGAATEPLPDEQVSSDITVQITAEESSAPIAAGGPSRVLTRVDGGAEVVHLLGRRTSIGRDPNNDIQLNVEFVSRTHAVVIAGPQQTFVEDLGSTNGTALNGRRITRAQLEDGDVVEIGKAQFRFSQR